MNLIDKKTGQKLNGVIEKVNNDDLKRIKKEKNFGFDWDLEADSQLFKLKLLETNEILGLIALNDYPHEFRIHINLIESSKTCRGKSKKILNIPHCLIAFVCIMASRKGYAGFVSLTPKTRLVEYYEKTYGFLHFGNQMAVFAEISEAIIQKYLGNEEI
ncbi:MAG: hypothetical protein ACI85O_002874 [Saprospiraceae bacterium]|jgi:hypothetical protein